MSRLSSLSSTTRRVPLPATGLETAARMASVAGPGSSSGRGTAAAAGRFPAGRGGSGAARGGGGAAGGGLAVGAGGGGPSGVRSLISHKPRPAVALPLVVRHLLSSPAAPAA